MRIQQGDIVLIPFPFSNLLGNKLRPALVISNDRLHRTKDFIGMAISRQTPSDIKTISINSVHLKEGIIAEGSFIHPHKINLLEQSLVQKVVGIAERSFVKSAIRTLGEYFV